MPSEWVDINVGGQNMEGYLTKPADSDQHPAVVVIQEIWGVNSHIQYVTDRLPSQGYVGLAPAMFHRQGKMLQGLHEEMDTAVGWMGACKDDEIVADVQATVDYLKAQSFVQSNHIGIVGFCMGGRAAWLAAATNTHYKATVPYYGGSIMVTRGAGVQTPLELADNINCPMLFHFGEIDGNPSQDDMAKLDAELTRLGKPHQFFSYPEADHGFADHTGARYNREGAEIAWPRTLQFFAAHLKGAPVV